MDFAKKYGKIGTEGTWFNHEDSSFCILAPNSRAMMLAILENTTVSELEEMDEEMVFAEKLKDMSAEEVEAHRARRQEEVAKKDVSDLIAKQARITSARIVDWKNVTSDGVEVPFSKEKAYEFCYFYPEFRAWVEKTAFDMTAETKQVESKKRQIKKK